MTEAQVGSLVDLLNAFVTSPTSGILNPSPPQRHQPQKQQQSVSLLLDPPSVPASFNDGHCSKFERTNPNSKRPPSSDLLGPRVDPTLNCMVGTNAGGKSIGGSSADVKRLFKNNQGNASPLIAFPSLCLLNDLDECIRDGRFCPPQSPDAGVARGGNDDLLARRLVAPALPSEDEPQGQCVLGSALQKLFYSLIHYRLGLWIGKLERAVDLEEADVDTNQKRVLVALLDVQSSLRVEEDFHLEFRGMRSGASTPEQEEQARPTDNDEVERMEQELADTLASMKSGPSCFEPGSPLPAYSKFSRARNSAKKGRPAHLLNLKQGDRQRHTQQQFRIVLDACTRVVTQIGEDLEQGQTIGISICGTVTGHYDDSKLIGVELELDTDELRSTLEKQARLVARSTAESVLIYAMTEVGPTAQEPTKQAVAPILRQNQHRTTVVAVSPISKHRGGIPSSRKTWPPLVSPPPSVDGKATGVDSTDEDQPTMPTPRRLDLGLMSRSFTLEPPKKRHRQATMEHEAVGALTSLKNRSIQA